MGFLDVIYGPFGRDITSESKSAVGQRNDLNNQGGMSSWFADQGQQGFAQAGQESQAVRDYLRRIAGGQESIAAEQLRQGLGQNLAAQRSMAAGAAPQNAAMAARNAAMNMGRLGAGMSGQAAMAGMQERRDAQSALGQMLAQQQQMQLQAALGARQNAIGAYGGVTPEKSGLEKYQPLLNATASAFGQAAGAK